MNFFKKFINHKITIQDVLSSLEKFDNDVKSLNDFKAKANEYFGVNWKFNLEVYISSLPKDYKEKLDATKEVNAALDESNKKIEAANEQIAKIEANSNLTQEQKTAQINAQKEIINAEKNFFPYSFTTSTLSIPYRKNSTKCAARRK